MDSRCSVFGFRIVDTGMCCSGVDRYGVATMSRLLKVISLFGEYKSLLLGSFAKETYNFMEPTNRSHPIVNTGI